MKIFTNAVSAFSLLAILILACCHVLEFPCSHVRQSSFIVPMITNTNIVNQIIFKHRTYKIPSHYSLAPSRMQFTNIFQQAFFAGLQVNAASVVKREALALNPANELSGGPCLPQFYAEVSSILKPKTRIPEVGVLTASLQPVLISELGRFNLFKTHTSLS